MSWPVPQPGLVVRYAYLWHREAVAGREEGVKDRPCAIVVATPDEDGETRVTVVPVTHSPPGADTEAIELPQTVKARLGLDGERSWVVLDEVNRFRWPGPDLRMVGGRDPATSAYSFLPPDFFAVLQERMIARYRRGRLRAVRRTE